MASFTMVPTAVVDAAAAVTGGSAVCCVSALKNLAGDAC